MISYPANSMVTAWTTQKTDNLSQAESFLKDWLENDPDGVWSKVGVK